jgi:hypothetical protein
VPVSILASEIESFESRAGLKGRRDVERPRRRASNLDQTSVLHRLMIVWRSLR